MARILHGVRNILSSSRHADTKLELNKFVRAIFLVTSFLNHHNQRGFEKGSLVFASTAVLLLVVGGLYFFSKEKPVVPSQPDENAAVSSQNDASKQTNEVVQETTTPLLSTTIDTSDWKTYHNEEYGYTIKYPNEYEISYQDTTDTLAIKKIVREFTPDYGGIIIGIERNPKNLSFDEYFDGQRAPKYSILEGRKLILPNEPEYFVYEFNPSTCLCTVRIIQMKDLFIDAFDADNEPLDAIISSIKFDE